MTPKEKGARKQSAYLSAHTQPAQREERLLITCRVKQPVKEAKLGKDNSILDGLQKHFHLRDLS